LRCPASAAVKRVQLALGVAEIRNRDNLAESNDNGGTNCGKSEYGASCKLQWWPGPLHSLLQLFVRSIKRACWLLAGCQLR
jgi:hypothetical protein